MHEQLLDPLLIISYGFIPAFSTKIEDYTRLYDFPYSSSGPGKIAGQCVWWHEEPLSLSTLDSIKNYDINVHNDDPVSSAEYNRASTPGSPSQPPMYVLNYAVNFHIFANSEKSNFKKNFLKEWKVYDWYFFFHGFAALSWFNNYKYLKFDHYKISKVFICLNHLVTNNRSYRLNLLANINSKKLWNFGHISAPLLTKEVIKKELTDVNSRLSITAKKNILNHLAATARPTILDVCDYNKSSASLNDDFIYTALWNVVTETNFYDEKLHLTEKIFKPIVSKRPFLLVSSPGNLAYLRSYGFETFDKWVDESYDGEPDPDKRISMITNELEKLCKLSDDELEKMHKEMLPVLEYNYNHFYNKFKLIITNELLSNFEGCIKQYNLHLSERWRIPVEKINFDQVKNLLLS